MDKLKEIEVNTFYSSEVKVELSREDYEWLIKQVELLRKQIKEHNKS